MRAAARAAIVAIVAITGLLLLGACTPAPIVEKGQPVPDFGGTTLTGQTVGLAALRGHPVVINFW